MIFVQHKSFCLETHLASELFEELAGGLAEIMQRMLGCTLLHCTALHC